MIPLSEKKKEARSATIGPRQKKAGLASMQQQYFTTSESPKQVPTFATIEELDKQLAIADRRIAEADRLGDDSAWFAAIREWFELFGRRWNLP